MQTVAEGAVLVTISVRNKNQDVHVVAWEQFCRGKLVDNSQISSQATRKYALYINCIVTPPVAITKIFIKLII